MKKHFHLMTGSVTKLSPEVSEYFTSSESAHKQFEERKEAYIKEYGSEDKPKLFFSIDEEMAPNYRKVCLFGNIKELQEFPINVEEAAIGAVGAVSGDWSPMFMIMLVECDDHECAKSIN